MQNRRNDRQRVDDQIGRLHKLSQRQFVEPLLREHARRRHLPAMEPDSVRRPKERVAIEVLRARRRKQDVETVVRGELLAQRYGDERDDRLAALLKRHGLRPAEGGPKGVVRYVAAGDAQPDLGRVLDEAEREQLRVSVNHVAALSGRMKGQSSPEYTDQPLPKLENLAPPSENDPLVVVIDTGLAEESQRRGDGWLHHIVPADDDLDPLDVVQADGSIGSDGYLDWGAGHGTFVAGVIRRVAPNARVVVLRALDTDGIGSELSVSDAIERAAAIFHDHGGRGVLNLSLGIESLDDLPPLAWEAALGELPEGVIAVAAAGNGGTSTKVWPAAFDGVMAVAGLTEDGRPADWSSHGDWVNFSTVGEGVVSTFVSGTETKGTGMADDPHDPTPETFPRDGQAESYALWTGTSFAAPQVAAWLANHLSENPQASTGAALQALRDQGNPIDGYGHAVPLL